MKPRTGNAKLVNVHVVNVGGSQNNGLVKGALFSNPLVSHFAQNVAFASLGL